MGLEGSPEPPRSARGRFEAAPGPVGKHLLGDRPGGAGPAPAPSRVCAGWARPREPGGRQAPQAYPATYRATKHVYAAEELPPLAAGDRFYERLLLVAFPKKLPSEDLVPERKLQEERDGILQWAMRGLRRVLGSEGFPCGRGPKETRQRWDALSGPIGRLKAGLLKVTGDPQDVIRKEDLYSTYKEFCRRENVFAETKDTLTRTLTEDPQIEARKRVPTSGADQVPCYVGVRWRES